MTPSFSAFNATYITTSGTGVLGATGKAVYLQAVYNSQASAQCIAFYSGTTATVMATVTFQSKVFTPFPMSFPGGCTYQTFGNPGDADLKTIFFWIPGSST